MVDYTKKVESCGDTVCVNVETELSSPLARYIAESVAVTRKLGPDYEPDCDNLESLLQRLEKERFHLAVLGQFKRGKSTLLNALLGAEVLPTSVVPLTAIPTFVEFGNTASALVIMRTGEAGEAIENASASELRHFLEEYVTEERNPRNQRGVREVIVRYPSSLLEKGVVLIDTPGIGSTYRHNTEATLEFLSQCDAAIFVTSPDPPITEVEVDFLHRVAETATRVFIVVNKADYLAETELQQAVAFIKRALRELAANVSQDLFFTVSARMGLRAKLEGDQSLWARSGMEVVERELIDFLASEKMAMLKEAIARKAVSILSEVGMQIEFSLKTLRMPIDELEQRMSLLREKLKELEYQRIAQLDILEGDRKRLIAFLEEQSAQLKNRARSALRGVLREAVRGSRAIDEEKVRALISEQVPNVFEQELARLSKELKEKTSETFARHRKRVDEVVESIHRFAAELFDVEYRPTVGAEWVETKHRPYWVTHEWTSTLSLLPEGFLDRLLPAQIRRRRALRRLEREIESVVSQNVENVRWPTLQNLEETFRKFAASIEAQYREAARVTNGAIEKAYSKRHEQVEAVESEAVELESSLQQLAELRSKLEAA
jgi:small GTP-binding protein